MNEVRRFRLRTALHDQVRDVEVRARRSGDAWETQAYLLPRPGSDPVLSHEEKMGTPVCFQVNSAQEALDEMMQHLTKYFRLEIE